MNFYQIDWNRLFVGAEKKVNSSKRKIDPITVKRTRRELCLMKILLVSAEWTFSAIKLRLIRKFSFFISRPHRMSVPDSFLFFHFQHLTIWNMTQLNLVAFSLVLMLSTYGALAAPTNGDSELLSSSGAPEISFKYLNFRFTRRFN